MREGRAALLTSLILQAAVLGKPGWPSNLKTNARHFMARNTQRPRKDKGRAYHFNDQGTRVIVA